MKFKTLICAAVLLGSAVSAPAMAMDAGNWLIRFGASNVDPKSNNHPIVDVDSAWSATFNFTYMMTDNWAVEVLAAWPFEHDIVLKDGTLFGKTKHLPPTVSLQYHFNAAGKFQPYVGAGINYTDFFSTRTLNTGGLDLKLDSSWGLAGEVGADIMMNDKWFINLNARYINIESDAKLEGDGIGKVKINPWVYGAHVGFRF
jgi:outer membrane protein